MAVKSIHILIFGLILIGSAVDNTVGLPIEHYFTWRRTFVGVESLQNDNQTVEVFFIQNHNWKSSEFPSGGITGNAIIANPSNACESVDPPPDGMFDEDNNGTNWFLVANNHDCDSVTKERHANEAGFTALILPPANDANNTDNSNSKCSEIAGMCETEVVIDYDEHGEFLNTTTIFTLILERNDWLLLAQNFTYPNPYIIKIEDQLEIVLFVLAIVIPLLIVIIFLVMCVISIKRLVSTIQECNRKRRIVKRNKLLSSTVQTLPIRKWTRQLDTLSEENKVCVICTENFQDDEEIRVLPCCHIYHLICVDQWILEGRPYCKICRHNLLPRNQRIPSSDLSDPSSDTLQPVYATCESTRLLISNQRSPGSIGPENPPVQRVMAVMPESFDASFEAMLPLRSGAPMSGQGQINGTMSPIDETDADKSNPPGINSTTGEDSEVSALGNASNSRGQVVESANHREQEDGNNSDSPLSVSQVSKDIYISEREDFV